MREMKDFEPGILTILDRHYDANGYEVSKVLRHIPAVICDFRVDSSEVPAGFNKYEIRGTDWTAVEDVPTLLELASQHRESMKNHLTDEEYDKLVSFLTSGDDDLEFTDEFSELIDAVNYACEDDGAPLIQGFEETMGRHVLVNFWQTVLIREEIDDLRKEFEIPDAQEIHVDTGYTDEGNCPLWKEFVSGFSGKE